MTDNDESTIIICQRLGPEDPDVRIVRPLYDRWTELRSDRDQLPTRADFPPEEPAQYGGTVSIIEEIDGGTDFRYRLYGTVITAVARADFTARLVSDFPFPDYSAEIIRQYREVLDLGTPTFYRMRHHWVRGINDYVRLAVPVTADDGQTRQLITAIWFHEDASRSYKSEFGLLGS